jgi:hypothetical protein
MDPFWSIFAELALGLHLEVVRYLDHLHSMHLFPKCLTVTLQVDSNEA